MCETSSNTNLLKRDVCQHFADLKTSTRHPFYVLLIQISVFLVRGDVCQFWVEFQLKTGKHPPRAKCWQSPPVFFFPLIYVVLPPVASSCLPWSTVVSRLYPLPLAYLFGSLVLLYFFCGKSVLAAFHCCHSPTLLGSPADIIFLKVLIHLKQI